ncbi:glutathione S-transferase family protein [Pseudaminobacter sp. NGMCC 1.201702]|uniref:glutathione S-transferase family protein n=1 Tax=Pseudaminobacter sp. NGMCC 1.201702 TaxID=3391825 RepID=UPI0039F0CA93
MKLFHAPTSPYVRKVMVIAHETGQLADLQLHFSGTTPIAGDPDLQTANPLGKIPALVLDDGSCLFDSRVICEYLAARAGDSTLFPPPGPQRWEALSRQALGDGLLDAALLARYEWLMRLEERRSPEWRAAQLRKVELALNSIEALIPTMGDEVTIGTITLGCALGYLDFRFPELAWRTNRPAAERWFAAFDARPSMVATRPRDRAVSTDDSSSTQR